MRKINETVQPFICAVGSEKFSYFVVIDEVKYIFNSSVKALEVILKIIYALNIKFCTISKDLWQVLANILLPNTVYCREGLSLSALTVQNQLENFMK